MSRARKRVLATLTAAVLAAGAFVIASPAADAAPTGVVIISVPGNGCQIGQIDLGTGALSNLHDTNVCSADIAYGPDGTLYGINRGTSELITYDPATGNTTVVGPLGFAPVPETGLSFDAAGRLWLTMHNLQTPCFAVAETGAEAAVAPVDCLYQVDPATGAATFVARLTTNAANGLVVTNAGLAGACDGRVLTDYQPGPTPVPGFAEPLVLASVNTGTALLTEIGPNLNGIVQSLDFQPSTAGTPQSLWGVGRILSAPNVGHYFSINPSTGEATDLGAITGAGDIFPLALAIAPIACPAAQIAPTFTG